MYVIVMIEQLRSMKTIEIEVCLLLNKYDKSTAALLQH